MLSDRIKKIRTENGLSQIEFGRKVGVSRTSVNAWEMGISAPSLVMLMEMSRLFKVSVDYILELENDFKISIGHLDEVERQMIVNMIKKFELLNETRKLLRDYNVEVDIINDEIIYPPFEPPFKPTDKNNDT